MTRKPGKWKGKDEEYFIILRKLANGSELRRTNFESPRKKARHAEFNETIQQKDDEGIPHASLIQRLKELLESNSIKEIKTKEKAYTGLPIRKYRITFIGFIKLLSLSNKKEYLADVMENFKDFLPLFSYEFDFLIQLFTEQQLFDTITNVCKNTDIEIDFDAKNRGEKAKLKNISVRGVPSIILLKSVKWAHQYYIEIKVRQLESTYLINRLVTIWGKTREEMTKETMQVSIMLKKFIMSAFFHELLMRCKRYDDEFSEYGHKRDTIPAILKRLQGNSILKLSYMKFLKEIESKHELEDEIMSGFMSSLSS